MAFRACGVSEGVGLGVEALRALGEWKKICPGTASASKVSTWQSEAGLGIFRVYDCLLKNPKRTKKSNPYITLIRKSVFIVLGFLST